MSLSKIKRNTVLLILIILLAAFLRFHNYTEAPRRFETWDEYAFAWQGWSLINERYPRSWSHLPAYDSFNFSEITWEGADNIRLVKPWFDHPPLFGLSIGLAATLAGTEELLDVRSIAPLRIPPIIFSLIALYLIYLLTKRWYGEKTGLIAALLYATIPSIAIGNRVAVSENLLIVFFLGSLVFLFKYFDTKQTKYRNLAAILSGLAFLTKIPGIIVCVVLIIFLAYKKRWKDILIVGLISGAISSLFVVYGWFYDFDLFMSVIFSLNGRGIHLFNNIFKIIFEPKIVIYGFFDFWILFGWFCFLFYLFKRDKKLITSILPYMILLGFIGSNRWGWYLIPFYPFLCIAIAKFMGELFQKGKLIFVLLFIIPGMWSFYLLFRRPSSLIMFLLMTIILIPYFLDKVLKIRLSEKFSFERYSYFVFFLFTLLNIAIILLFPSLYYMFTYGWSH